MKGTWNVFRSEKRTDQHSSLSAAEWDDHGKKAEADSLVLVQVHTGQKMHTGALGTEDLRAAEWHHPVTDTTF